jgi:F-type H+-transporting ATPase subunit delta
MSAETIARRYAAALADAAVGNAETVKEELAAWKELILGNPELAGVFGNPAIPSVQKENIISELIARTKPSAPTANFVRILLQNGRLMNIGDISSRFEAELAERSGNVSAKVTTARGLSPEQTSELKANLEKLTGKTVALELNTDSELLGGVIAQVGSTIYDSSVRTQLENLRKQIING